VRGARAPRHELGRAGRGDGVRVQAPVEVQDKAELCRARGKDAPYGDVDFIVGIPPSQLRCAAESEIVERTRAALGSTSATLKNDNTFSFLTSERHQVELQFCHALAQTQHTDEPYLR